MRYLAYVLILLLAFALRVHDLNGKLLSGDEAYGYVLAGRTLGEVLRPGMDLHPPLYHLLEHLWLPAAGTSPFALRSVALALGVLFVAAAMGLARRIGNTRAALAAGLLAALMPLGVYYAQDARMYTLLVLTTTLSTWAFVRLVETPRAASWALYALATLAAMYTQYGAFWVIGAHNVTALLVGLRGGRAGLGFLARWGAGQAALALVYLPWIVGQAQTGFLTISAAGAPSGGFDAARGVEIAALSVRAWVGGHTPDALTGVGTTDVGTLLLLALAGVGFASAGVGFASTGVGFASTGVGFASTGVGVARIFGADWRAWLLAGVTLATLLMVGVTNAAMGYFNARLALAGSTGALLLAALGVASVRQHGTRVTRLLACSFRIAYGALLVLMLGATLRWYAQPATAKHDYGQVMADIRARALPGDVIWFSNPTQSALMAYYAPPDVPGVLLDVARVNSPAHGDYLAGLLGDARRVWLVEFGDPIGYDSMRLVPAFLLERGALEWRGGIVALYNVGRPPGTWLPIAAQFGDSIRLTAYQLAVSGGAVQVALRWEALGTPGADYHVGVYVLRADGTVLTQTDSVPRGGSAPTAGWTPGAPLDDAYAVPLPAGTPPGNYTVAVTLYRYPDLTRAPLTAPADADLGGSLLRLGTVVLP